MSYNPVRAAPATNSTPVFTSETATRSVGENAEIGANVGTPITAADAENDPLTYSLDGNTVPFEILQASGQLQTTAALDFEETASYTVTVIATDPSDKSDSNYGNHHRGQRGRGRLGDAVVAPAPGGDAVDPDAGRSRWGTLQRNLAVGQWGLQRRQ